jgi:hypothetical protein
VQALVAAAASASIMVTQSVITIQRVQEWFIFEYMEHLPKLEDKFPRL